MDIFPGERLLLESDNGKLLLTSHRVRFTMNTWSISRFTSIMLEQITSCEITVLSYPRLLALALLYLGVTIYARAAFSSLPFLFGIDDLILPAILVLIYFATRRKVISLHSAGASIRIPITRMNAGTAMEFISTLETAKNERYLLKKQLSSVFTPV